MSIAQQDFIFERTPYLIVERLRQSPGGALPKRALQRAMHYGYKWSGRWDIFYAELLRQGVIRETGTGKRGSPRTVELVDKDANASLIQQSVWDAVTA
jgi:hypothetical protein